MAWNRDCHCRNIFCRSLADSQNDSSQEKKYLAEKSLEIERNLFVGGPTVIFKWSALDDFEYVSQNVPDLTGYDQDDFMSGRVTFSSIDLPEEKQAVINSIKEISFRSRLHGNLFPDDEKTAAQDGFMPS